MSKETWTFHKKVEYDTNMNVHIKATIKVEGNHAIVTVKFDNDEPTDTDVTFDTLMTIEKTILKDNANKRLKNLVMTDTIVLTKDEDGKYIEIPVEDGGTDVVK